MSRITKLEKQKGGSRRVSVFVDDRFVAGVSAGSVERLGLKVGREVGDNLFSQIHRASAWESAVRSLLRREHSRAELAGKLSRKGFPGKIVASVLDELEESGSLNDQRFARLWVERRMLFRPRGRRMLELELAQKGIAADVAQEVLATQVGPDQEREALIGLIRRRLRSAIHADPQVAGRRLLGFLARRGFSYEDVHQVLAEHFPKLHEENET